MPFRSYAKLTGLLVLLALGSTLDGCRAKNAGASTDATADAAAFLKLSPDEALPGIREFTAERQARLCLQLSQAWLARGEPGYAGRYLDHVEHLPTGLPGDIAPRVALGRALLVEKAGQTAEALLLLARAEGLVPPAGQEDLRFEILTLRKEIEFIHGHLEAALNTTRGLLRLAEIRPAALVRGSLRYDQGMLLYQLGRPAEAKEAGLQALDIFTAAGSQNGIAQAKKLLGNVESAGPDRAAALQYYEEARALFVATGNVHEAANCRFNAANLYQVAGDRLRMRAALDEAVILFTQAGSLSGVGLCQMSGGAAFLEDGDFLRAQELLGKAEKIFTEADNRFRLGQTKQALAELSRRRGDAGAARRYETEAQALLKAAGR